MAVEAARPERGGGDLRVPRPDLLQADRVRALAREPAKKPLRSALRTPLTLRVTMRIGSAGRGRPAGVGYHSPARWTTPPTSARNSCKLAFDCGCLRFGDFTPQVGPPQPLLLQRRRVQRRRRAGAGRRMPGARDPRRGGGVRPAVRPRLQGHPAGHRLRRRPRPRRRARRAGGVRPQGGQGARRRRAHLRRAARRPGADRRRRDLRRHRGARRANCWRPAARPPPAWRSCSTAASAARGSARRCRRSRSGTGCRWWRVARARDFRAFLERAPEFAEHRARVAAYLREYGA